MQTDKDLFELIKETYPLNPREEFVSATSKKLRQSARKLNNKRRIKLFSYVSSSIAICAIALTCFFIYGGKDTEQEGIFTSIATEKKPIVYIYQSHNFESFFTKSNMNDPAEALHETDNITLVGEKLSQSLIKKGIPTIHDKTNIMGILKEKGLSFNDAYTISREPLKSTLEKNKSLKMVFDIHRDSRKRNETTIEINGKDYSRTVFVVSRSSAKYEENLKFAELLDEKIKEKFPGLSRGVIVKDNPTSRDTYNQDLFGNSVLLEIGGVENTLQEEYRTVDILVEVIEEILKEKEI